MRLILEQKNEFSERRLLKNSFVDTFVSTNRVFLGHFLNFNFTIPKCFQEVSLRGVKIVTKNTMKSMVTTVFWSFLVTVLEPTPYENGLFLGSPSRFGDFFDAMSEVVTIKNRTADFKIKVKENDRY